MSDISTVVSVASLAVSAISLIYTVVVNQRMSDETSETFAVIGADEGNHEARLEQLEKKAGLKIIPSPSALDEMLDVPTGADAMGEAFKDEQENTELRASDVSDHAHARATGEGMPEFEPEFEPYPEEINEY